MNVEIDLHEFWMDKARLLALSSLPEDVPVGALILDSTGTLLAEGFNERERNRDSTAHAEIIALRKACTNKNNWRLKGCTMYVTLEPCPMCASAILQARVSTIVFGASDPVQGALETVIKMANYYSTHVTIIGGVKEEQCQQDLQEFFKNIR